MEYGLLKLLKFIYLKIFLDLYFKEGVIMQFNALTILITIVAFIVVYVILKKLFKVKTKFSDLENRYKNIIDIDAEILAKKKQLSYDEETVQNRIAETEVELQRLKEKYLAALKVLEELSKKNALLQDNLDIAEYGIYEPYFDYDTSEEFKKLIIEVKNKQKEFIKNKTAVNGGQNWTVNDSKREGMKMINRQKKLMLRAFNGECDSFIANAKWNNVTRLKERIRKSFDVINKMGDTQGIIITESYLSLKIKELRLTYEYHLKKHYEKEQQRRIREQMREEEKAKRDYERAQKEAEKQEKLIQQALNDANKEFIKANEEEKAILQRQLNELVAKLKKVESQKQRAISMAEQTKSGHVYIISNIGSFGENIYKIGMTRRLDPNDRVNELGGASVPFKFDIHAMIYSENAPELENKLHKHFEKSRVNMVNKRREYFNVNLKEIEQIVNKSFGNIEFIIDPEAREFRESLKMIDKLREASNPKPFKSEFSNPEELFG